MVVEEFGHKVLRRFRASPTKTEDVSGVLGFQEATQLAEELNADSDDGVYYEVHDVFRIVDGDGSVRYVGYPKTEDSTEDAMSSENAQGIAVFLFSFAVFSGLIVISLLLGAGDVVGFDEHMVSTLVYGSGVLAACGAVLGTVFAARRKKTKRV